MKIRILYHDHCFDGAASAAFFSRFHNDHVRGGAEYAYTGMAHTAAQQFADDLFDGDENAIVDFKYAPSEKLTWWFDHHQSAFLSAADADHYRRHRTERKMYDPAYRSCTTLIRDKTKELWGYEAADLAELAHWAEIIDGALYASAEEAVEMRAPAMQLTLAIEGAHGSEFVQKVIGMMQRMPLDAIMREPGVQAVFQPLRERHLRSLDLIRDSSIERDGVVFFDLVESRLEGYNKFIPYYLHPRSVYTVSVSVSPFRTKISVGSNPWAPVPLKHNLASICERYGGGGHPKVGAISLRPGEVEAARTIAAEIVGELAS